MTLMGVAFPVIWLMVHFIHMINAPINDFFGCILHGKYGRQSILRQTTGKTYAKKSFRYINIIANRHF